MRNVSDFEWDSRLMQVYNINSRYLPTIIHKPGTVVGCVTEAASIQTMLPVGCKVCVGGLDVNCSSLAGGANKSGIDVLIVGTAGCSVLVTDKLIKDSDQRVVLRSNPGFGNYQLFIATYTAGSSFRWFRDELCALEVAVGELIGADPYDLITKMAQMSKPGSNGITAIICLQGACGRIKNEKARGAFLNIDLGTTKADFAQAILEGITFEIYDLIQMKEKLSPVEMVRLSGGVAKSPYWCQMFSDILQKPVEISREAELGGLGAAMCAGVGAGIFKDLNDAIEKCVHIVKTYYPIKENLGAYQAAYSRWSKAYDVLNQFYYK